CVMENGGIAARGSSEEWAAQPVWARLSAGRAMEGATR
ncbi:ABC transporter ATP-binding protein, partial [Cutibacterium acnes]